MKKLVFWGVIAAMFILGGGGAGAYISHANTQARNTPANTNSNSGKKNAATDEQKSNDSDVDSNNKENSSQDASSKSSDKKPDDQSSSSSKKDALAPQARRTLTNQVHLLLAASKTSNLQAANLATLPLAAVNPLPHQAQLMMINKSQLALLLCECSNFLFHQFL